MQQNDFFSGLTSDDTITLTLPGKGTWKILASPEGLQVLRAMCTELSFQEDLNNQGFRPRMTSSTFVSIQVDGRDKRLILNNWACPLGSKSGSIAPRGEFIPHLVELARLGATIEGGSFDPQGEENFVWDGTATVTIQHLNGQKYVLPGYGVLFWHIGGVRRSGKMVEGAPYWVSVSDGERTMRVEVEDIHFTSLSRGRVQAMARAAESLSAKA